MSYFAELLHSIATLQVKIFDATATSAFEFKSEDGDFYMNVTNPDITILIKGLGIKLIAKQQRIEQIPNCLIFSFKLDPLFLKPIPNQVLTTPKVIKEFSLQCKCGNLLSKDKVTVRPAPSENFYSTSSLWKCHNECYDSIIDPTT